MAEQEERPSQVFARRMREVRERRGWKQHDLAAHLRRMGVALDRTAVARIETGNRGLSLDEAMGIDAALAGAPMMRLLAVDVGEGVLAVGDLGTFDDQARPLAFAWVAGGAEPGRVPGRIHLLEKPPTTFGSYRSLEASVTEVVSSAAVHGLESDDPRVRQLTEAWIDGAQRGWQEHRDRQRDSEHEEGES